MCVRECLPVRALVRVCALADAGARVRVRMCLCVGERTRECVGAHAYALEGAGSLCEGMRARIMYV